MILCLVSEKKEEKREIFLPRGILVFLLKMEGLILAEAKAGLG